MSRAVRLQCNDCGAPFDRPSSDGVNHGEKVLRELWATRDAVYAVMAPQVWDFHDVRGYETFGHGDWFAWIAAHAKHNVILRDEYGGTAPIDGTESCRT